MTLLHIAVLVGLAGLNPLPQQPVMIQQPLAAPRELRLATRSRLQEPGQVMHRRRQPIRSMLGRDSAQGPQGVLQALREALIALREADRAVLPVRVRQHEVVNHVVERLAGDRNAQLRQVGEVRLAESARLVHLGEEHLPRRSFQRPPGLDPALKRPQLPILEPTWMPPLQRLEQHLGLQPRIDRQFLAEPRPKPPRRGRPASATCEQLRSRRATASAADTSVRSSRPSPPSPLPPPVSPLSVTTYVTS